MRLIDAIKDPRRVLFALGIRGHFRFLNDETYLKFVYWCKFHRKMNLDNPVRYTEKLQWLKLYDRKPEYTRMVDKCDVKEYVGSIIGEEYLIPTLGVWDDFSKINFDSLPNQFVMKSTHDSGGIVICKDKETFDIEAAKKKIEKSLKRNYYWAGREWPYKNVKPRIIAEEFMEDNETAELRDYKFFCFNGKAKALFIASERQDTTTETKFDFYDMDFKHLDIRNGHPNADVPPQKPKCFEEMKELAEKLSKNIPHLRVDFYEVNGKVYFGELTFSHWSGLIPFEPDEWDATFGSWIELPER